MIRTITALLLTLVFVPAIAQEPSPEDSALRFAQGFYHWYVPIAVNDNRDPAFAIAIKRKPGFFGSRLLKALQEDAAAQAKAEGEIVGLDFDPFLNSQDPSNQYFLGVPAKKKDGYWIDVYHSRTNQKHGKPDITAVVGQSNGHWVFSNFRFPHGGDLLKTLQELKAERQE